jgi:alkanesulfonate monooxygenase SsuD/methylene tetrahydromethanopterin reductase-like flavin-dependent oxidoreductase (luciferase family)
LYPAGRRGDAPDGSDIDQRRTALPTERLRQGIFIAPFDELSDPRLLADLAVQAERRGWDGVFLWDHIQYDEHVGQVSDVWVTLGAMAYATERVLLGALVTPLARRRPWKLSREIVTLDHLSGGRMVLGLGVGGDRLGEMDGFGEQTDIRVRAEMLDEGLELLEELWSGEPVDHAGEHYQAHARPFLPRPVQRPRIPVWLGARWPNRGPIRRAARWDGVFPIAIEPEQVAEMVAEIETLRGPDAGPFDVCLRDLPGADPTPWARAGATWLLTELGPAYWAPGGGPTPSLAELRAAIDAGPAG